MPIIQAETDEEELKLDFSSDEEEPEENDSLKSEDITLDYVLTRLSISGLDRTDQVYLQAISESLSTSIPAGVDECGVAFLFAFSHLNYVKKYGRSGDKEVDSAAASWAFHSQSQVRTLKVFRNYRNKSDLIFEKKIKVTLFEIAFTVQPLIIF